MIKRMLIGAGIFIAILIIGGISALIIYSENKPAEIKIGDSIFKVEIADSIISQARGLSGRKNLPEDEGMLFIFNSPQICSFWMKGMNFPLDIIWISGNKIIQIDKDVPFPGGNGGDFELYSPSDPVDKVLEINAGLSDKFGIKTGDEIINTALFK
ncbi:MAG: DUF192 domain-containing protein [Patescibacteria group bacterium]